MEALVKPHRANFKPESCGYNITLNEEYEKI